MRKNAAERADIAQRRMSVAQARMMAVRASMPEDPSDDEWAKIYADAQKWAAENTTPNGDLRAGVEFDDGLEPVREAEEEWQDG